MGSLQDVILRGTRADQPLVTDVVIGSLYFVTDENVIEQSDGSNWVSYSGPVPVSGATFITVTDETADLANSRMLVAGANVTLDTTTPGQISIASSGGAGSGIDELTGDVTAGPGSGAQVATIANDAVTTAKIADGNVTKAKIENVTASRLLGRGDSGVGAPEEITLGSGLTLTGTTLAASGGGGSDWDVEVVKTIDESVTNDAVLQPDDELFITAPDADSVWLIEILLVYNGPPAGDMKLTIGHSSGSALNGVFKATGMALAGTAQDTVALVTVQQTFGSLAGDLLARLVCLITMPGAASPGNFIVNWAQNTANASPLTVKAGSLIRGKQLI